MLHVPEWDTVAAIESTDWRRMVKKYPPSHRDAVSTSTVAHRRRGGFWYVVQSVKTGPSERQSERMTVTLRACLLVMTETSESRPVRDEPRSFRACHGMKKEVVQGLLFFICCRMHRRV